MEKNEEQVEKNDEEKQEESSVVATPTKSTQEVNKELDEKIAKLKHFLDRAKSKRFSTLRFVDPYILISQMLSLFGQPGCRNVLGHWPIELTFPLFMNINYETCCLDVISQNSQRPF